MPWSIARVIVSFGLLAAAYGTATAQQPAGPITVGQPIQRVAGKTVACNHHTASQYVNGQLESGLLPTDCLFSDGSLSTSHDVVFELGGLTPGWIVSFNTWDATSFGGPCSKLETSGRLAQVDYWIRPPGCAFPGKYIGMTQYQHVDNINVRWIDRTADSNGFVREPIAKVWSNNPVQAVYRYDEEGNPLECWTGRHIHTISSQTDEIESNDGTYTATIDGPLEDTFSSTAGPDNVLWHFPLRTCATGAYCGAGNAVRWHNESCQDANFPPSQGGILSKPCGTQTCNATCGECPAQPITPPDVGTGSGSYGNCGAYGCLGPNLTRSWPLAQFRVRYKCCFVPDWGQWLNVGTATSYTAPQFVHDYEVEVLALTASGTFVQWYPWKSGNKNGTTKTVTWAAAKYEAQLTHYDFFINACNSGDDNGGAPLPGCTDYRGFSTTSSATFVGLSPRERYDLFVSIKQNENTGTTRAFNIHADVGPTGDCHSCVSLPTDSCLGHCGGNAGDCWCDAYCVASGDCCDDYAARCGIVTDCSAPVVLRPQANGPVTTWDTQVPSTGQHWDKVDEVTSDGDGTYLSSTVDGRWNEFTHSAITFPAGATINQVTVRANARYATSGAQNVVAPALRVAGNAYWADRTILGTYSTVSGSWTLNPATAQPWSATDVNAMMFGVRKSYQGANVRVSQVWAEVTCTPPPPPSCAAPIVLRPTANGISNNWDNQIPAMGSHWQRVSETTADNDTSYISSTTDGRWDDFVHSPLTIPGGATITRVTVYARARWATSGAQNIVGPALRSQGAQVWADRPITAAWSNVSGAWTTDPATGQAWTVAGVNSAQIGVRKSYQGADVRVTQVWAEVECSGP